MNKKLKVCLTGGIASGKTYVSDQLAEFGAYVIDADVLAREVVSVGSIGLKKVVDTFGPEVLKSDQSLNRKVLKNIVFKDDSKLKKLNQILHPLIREAFENHSQKNKLKIEVWVIPLYDGSVSYQGFDRVLVVDVSTDIQIQRMQKRDGVNLELAQKIIESQPSRVQRLVLASDVISNRYTFKELDENIRHVYQLYQHLSNQQLSPIN